eukprot:CAMPEP_0116889444 /NCGR_PEP_ID=MMETSP0463-20121206/24936_1 /TAXON_ID=181622 /ORGANISM="Strombidinopsis sp, Strain SopsisLIS2011" /LENGTH=57 /DNA_ID=CAMNT_0004556155 /DNA_START=297 /DNA_END=470 /DNA_ORIENTATION=+
MDFDISKCFIDGKPLIVDGSQIDPESFLKSWEENEIDSATGKNIRKINHRIVTLDHD